MSSPAFGVISPHPPVFVRAVGGSRAQITHDSLDALGRAGEALYAYAPETIVVMSPHAPALADEIAIDDAPSHSGSLAQFGDLSVRTWSGDPELAREVLAALDHARVPALARSQHRRLEPGVLDHGVLVPLNFLDPEQRFALVVISLSFLPYGLHRSIGEAVLAAAVSTGRRTAFIASGDLSHRLTPDAPAGYSPRASSLDDEIVRLVEAGSFTQLASIDPDLIEAGGECGLRSIIALGGFCGPDPVPSRVLAYEGPWGVGYLTALVGAAAVGTPESGTKGGSAGHDASEIVRLARSAIESFVRDGRRVHAPELADPEYPARAGAFVSLHEGGELRGCIGTILPTRDTLAEEVAANAVEAATSDPRFPPTRADELEKLDVKVDVLHAPEACELTDLDPKRYGVIATSGWRRGLLLPDLDGVDDVATQVGIAMSKGGIRPGEACSIERFKVDRYT